MRFAFIALIILSASGVSGQENGLKPAKKYDHFVGLQVNPLLGQILSFGDADPVNNPFLLKYTVRNNQTGLAFNIGGGVGIRSTESDAGLRTTDNTFDIRAGIGHQKLVSKRLEMGVGIDLIYGRGNRETSSVQVTDLGSFVDSTITRVRNTSNRFGGGLQVSLNYQFSERLLVGTESTLYYTRTSDRFNAEVENFFIPNPEFNPGPTTRTITVVNEEDKGGAFALLLPVAIYLSYKF